uniref:Uncharacterized protein n=3 Tax=Brassica TaxID=3705 RepID=M4ECK7_BRACM
MSFTRRVLSMKESYFTGGEEPGFIDLKFDSSGGGEVVVNDGVLEHGGGGGSCRLTKKDREAHVKPNTNLHSRSDDDDSKDGFSINILKFQGSNKHHEDDLELQGQQKLVIAQ